MMEIRENISTNGLWLLTRPTWMYSHIKRLQRKKERGQPISFTDFFGYMVGDTLLKQVGQPACVIEIIH